MQTEINGIHALVPARWRSLDGIVGVHWDAEGHAGASGYYLSPDPRIMLFFNDVSEQIKIADREVDLGRGDRGLCRAIYVPAGVPMWTRFTPAFDARARARRTAPVPPGVCIPLMRPPIVGLAPKI